MQCKTHESVKSKVKMWSADSGGVKCTVRSVQCKSVDFFPPAFSVSIV